MNYKKYKVSVHKKKKINKKINMSFMMKNYLKV